MDRNHLMLRSFLVTGANIFVARLAVYLDSLHVTTMPN